MKELKDYFVPWLMTAREYNVSILDKAWANPNYARLMLNENPIPPSEKVRLAKCTILARIMFPFAMDLRKLLTP